MGTECDHSLLVVVEQESTSQVAQVQFHRHPNVHFLGIVRQIIGVLLRRVFALLIVGRCLVDLLVILLFQLVVIGEGGFRFQCLWLGKILNNTKENINIQFGAIRQ